MKRENTINKLLGKKRCKGCGEWFYESELSHFFNLNNYWCDRCLMEMFKGNVEIKGKRLVKKKKKKRI